MAKNVKEEAFKTFVNEVALAVNMIGNDLMKTQKILYSLMDELNMIEKPNCVHCKEQLMIPILEGLERSEDCPNCGKNIYGAGQPSFEDWDDGTDSEE